MAFTKLTKSVLNITALPDRVENQAQVLKATFDQAGVDIKEAHNALIDELELNSSASNIGARNTQMGNSTVQTELDLLNTKLANKVDKASGKQLSTEDYTTAEKIKLANISEGANNYELPEASTTTLGGIKVDGSTIVVENGVAKAKAADAADYIARAEIEVLKQEKAETITYTTTIPSTGWTAEAPYYVDITVEGLLETDNPMITPVYTGTVETDTAIKEAWNKIDRAVTSANSLRVYAFEEVPTTDILVQLQVVR
jgi:hypothetical protein